MNPRRKTYDYMKERKERFYQQVRRLLGGKCETCPAEDAARIEFRDLSHPDRKRYQSNKVTLYRRILDGETNSRKLMLLCGDCWIDHRKETHDKAN